MTCIFLNNLKFACVLLFKDEIEAVRKSQQQKKQAELKFLKEQMEEAHLVSQMFFLSN